MNRLAWMSLGTLSALAGGTVAWLQASYLGLDDSPAASVICAIVVGLLVFYILSFAIPAGLIALQMAATNRRLARLFCDPQRLAPFEPRALAEAVGGCCVTDVAQCYIDGLRPAAAAGERWRGRDPEIAFATKLVIDDPLMTVLYCRFALIFIALALVALLMGCAGIIDDGLTSVTAMTELRATLVSSATAFGAAAFAFLAQPLLTALCQSQLHRFVLLLRHMYSVDDGSRELRQLVDGLSELRREIAGLAGPEIAVSSAARPRLRSSAAQRPRVGA